MDSVAIDTFVEAQESFETYVFRFEFLGLNAKITEEWENKSRFVTEIGSKCFILAVNLFAPRKLSKVTYKELVEALEQHFKPSLLDIKERYYFYKFQQ